MLAATFGSAVLFTGAYPASKLAGNIVTEDPTGYRLLALCGLAAAMAIAGCAWWGDGPAVAAGALAAAAVFAFAAYAVAAHWHAITRRAPPARSFRPSPLLPFFAAVALAGAASGLVLAVQRWRSAPPSG